MVVPRTTVREQEIARLTFFSGKAAQKSTFRTKVIFCCLKEKAVCKNKRLKNNPKV